MRESDYFDNLLLDVDLIEEKIVRVLVARGFFIDKFESGYYISDNGTANDLKYLISGLEKYDLGKVVDEERISATSAGEVRYISHRIAINESADVEKAILFYKESGRVSNSITRATQGWDDFLFREHGLKCDVEELEPYVAYYVKALSSCGVWTVYSCDGNHDDHGGAVIVESDYPFYVWQEIIQREFLSQYEPRIVNVQRGARFNSDNQYDLYYGLYRAADFLYRDRWNIRGLKNKIKERGFDKKFIRKHDDETIRKNFEEMAETVIKEAKEEGDFCRGYPW